MRSKLLLAAVILVALAGSFVGRVLMAGRGSRANNDLDRSRLQGRASGGYSRIVSLSPSITEILFALGLGDQVVGVTRYCKSPPEALSKPKVGGYSDPNYEAIVMLEPDLVVALPEHETCRKRLAGMDVNVLEVDHRHISGILESVEIIGKVCGAEAKARRIISDLETRMNHIVAKTRRLRRPRVMISMGRNMGSGSLNDVYIAGRGTFYDEMIALAGGANAYQGQAIPFPIVSGEGIVRLNPEVIVDMVPDLMERGWNEETVLKEWESVAGAEAVTRNRVHVFGDDYVARPGPKFILILEEMARVIHPEVKWD